MTAVILEKIRVLQIIFLFLARKLFTKTLTCSLSALEEKEMTGYELNVNRIILYICFRNLIRREK